MGKAWDAEGGVATRVATWQAAKLLLKPGGHLTAFAGSRTYHRIATAIECAGFEIRDQLMWIYGSGFPKSHDVSKAIDKAGGVWRGRAGRPLPDTKRSMGQHYEQRPKGAPVFDAAREWEGWGTALKPAHEPIVLARKPFNGTIAANVQEHGTAALNIDGGRIHGHDSGGISYTIKRFKPGADLALTGGSWKQDEAEYHGLSKDGRWPANVLTDGSADVLEAFPPSARDAIRFFYAPKADKAEREYGLADAPHTRHAGTFGDGIGVSPKVNGQRPISCANVHPTVKPIDLMRWLARLTTVRTGVVLDPFMGSGSTGIAAVREGFRFIGIEQSPEYFDIARRRIEQAVADAETQPDLVKEIDRAVHAMRAEQQEFCL